MFVIVQAAEPVINGLEIAKQVDSFYFNAWIMLMGSLTALGSVGAFMLYRTKRQQLASFKETEERLKVEIEKIKTETKKETKEEAKKDVKTEVKALKAEIEHLKTVTEEGVLEEIGSIDQRFDEKQKKLEELDKEIRTNRGEFYGQMANIFEIEFKKVGVAILFRITSMIEYAEIRDYEQITKGLNFILSYEDKIKTNAETKTGLLDRVAEIRKILIKQDKIIEFAGQLRKLEEWIENAVVVEEPKPD